MQVLFECGKFEMPESMPATEHLVQELAGMRAKRTIRTLALRGAPDDLALSRSRLVQDAKVVRGQQVAASIRVDITDHTR